MDGLKLTIATTDYDHFPDFQLGVVKAEGIQHGGAEATRLLLEMVTTDNLVGAMLDYGPTLGRWYGPKKAPREKACPANDADEPRYGRAPALVRGRRTRRMLPRRAIVRYREDYGDTDGVTAKGLKLDAEAVANAGR